MSVPRCGMDVWSLEYQEMLVDAHAQDTQVKPTIGCEDRFITGDDIIRQNNKKYAIKK